ncbi:MAG: glycosyltransferase family 2 protein [Acidimicrobiales bacterium]
MRTTRFSIITPVHDPDEAVLRETIDSVQRQTHRDWELCLVDDGSTRAYVRAVLEQAAAADARIKVRTRPDAGGIVAASNDALDMATGDFVAFLDHDDLLHPGALEAIDQAIRANPRVDYLYTDEDKITEDGVRYDPFLKPAWSPERFRTQMYTCHLSVARRSLVEEVGRFRPGYDGAQDWDLVLRVTERARQVEHVRGVYYHWRAVETSVAHSSAAKPWAYEAARKAIADHLERTGLQGIVDDMPNTPGEYRILPALQDTPLVSIIIPTAGGSRPVRFEDRTLVVNCVRNLIERTTYPSYEIVVVADATAPAEVLDELLDLGGGRLRIVPFDRPFHFSEKINVGALHARGDYLLLLNDDTEAASDHWLDALVMYALLPGVGAVGARLRFSDGRLQHVGIGATRGAPGHFYYGFPSDHGGYFDAAALPGDFLAVTGACLLTSRDCFEEVGGLSPAFPLNYNDVDYCLKVHNAGHRIVYTPEAELWHYESSTRQAGPVDSAELDLINARWGRLLHDDPYNHPGFVPGQLDHFLPPVLADGTILGWWQGDGEGMARGALRRRARGLLGRLGGR